MEGSHLTRGKLIVISGCMFSGKTTELLRRLAAAPSGPVQVFKHAIDDRYRGDAVVAHTGEMRDAEVVRGAGEIAARIHAATRLVAIDEAHFFGMELCEVVATIRARGVEAVVTTLDRGSWGQRFPVVDRLLGLADECVRKVAACAVCGGRAERTQRLTPVLDRRLVGGPEAYEPRCAKCWHAPREPIPNEEWRRANEGRM